MRCIWTLRSIHTCIGIGTLQVLPVRFTSFKQVLSLCASCVMHMTSMGPGSYPIDSLPCLMHRISLAFSCCLWKMCVCIQPTLASMVGGLPDKSSSPSRVFIISWAVHLALFIKQGIRRAVLFALLSGCLVHRLGVSETHASCLRGSITSILL